MKDLSLLIVLIALISANLALGQPQTSTEGDVIPSLLQDKELEKIIAAIEPGTDALVKCYINYEATTTEGPFLFTGALATGVFIYEQITGSK